MPFRYTRTARDQIVYYRIDPHVIENQISSGRWIKVSRMDIFETRFLHRKALFTVKFANYKEYILILSIHRTTSRIAIRKAKSK